MIKWIVQFYTQLCVVLMLTCMGCVSNKSECQDTSSADIRHLSMIAFQVMKESSCDDDGAIEIRVWWSDVWKDVRGIPSDTLAGDDPKRREVMYMDDYFREGDYVVIPPFRTTTNKLNEQFSFGWIEEVDPSWSEYFYYLKGTEWHREEKFSGFMVRGEIVQATKENIHLRGTISRLNHAPFSCVWPFDVIIPYEKYVIIWEMREWPKDSTYGL